MDQNKLRERLRRVVTIANDSERNEAIRRVYEDVLQAIANGALRHRQLARDALTLQGMSSTTSRSVF